MANIGIYYNIEFKQYLANIIYNKQIPRKRKPKKQRLTLTEKGKKLIYNMIKERLKIYENDGIGKLFEENIR